MMCERVVDGAHRIDSCSIPILRATKSFTVLSRSAMLSITLSLYSVPGTSNSGASSFGSLSRDWDSSCRMSSIVFSTVPLHSSCGNLHNTNTHC
ncbi:hypothetical protein NP493_644g01009 [Ridgeia piscesae]|uniref:Uncharacterized protein n=1 Tax=Ridgeia piscesae TaxID=27915 RepID=A0AAD9KS92_RIDPI|nr:hypothetical protein NP493_644g01009 [Ridgeia piscesae]